MEELNYCYKYPRPSVTTDCVIFGFENETLSVLLVQRGFDPYKGCWAFPGGFLNMDEDAETGAKRELLEETGLVAETVEQFGAFSTVDRDPRGRVITIAFYALVQKGKVTGSDDAADARWFPLNEIPSLAFDHDEVLSQALRSLREKLHFQPIGLDLLPTTFSFEQLFHLYSCIPNVNIDIADLKRQLMAMKLLKEVDEQDGLKRYQFNKTIYQELKENGFRLDF